MQASISTDDQARGVDKKRDEVIVIDDDDDDDVPGVFIKDEDVDRFPVSGDTNFPGQEMVNPNEISQSNDKGYSPQR